MKSRYLKISVPVLVLLIAVLLPVSSSAQFNLEKKADQYYNDFAYSKAAEIYEKLYQEDHSNSRYIQRLAYCYNKMLDYRKALKYYSQLVQSELHQSSDFYEYAQLLRIDGKYDEFKTWLEKYMVQSPGDQRAKKQLENIARLLKLKSDLGNITIRNLSVNTRASDMCPAFYQDQLVYSSARDTFSMIRNKYKWNGQSFLDLYVSKPEADRDLKSAVPFSTSLNSRFHEGSVCFTSDFNTVYFTRNSFVDGKVSKTSEGINNLKIFIADFDGKEWKNIRNFPYNSNSYSVGHPALSADNKTLYFISDMPGGMGETDIYQSEWTNGSWSKPLNLGAGINTAGKEMFPFVDKEGILYFASNGHPGIGGFDLFAARPDESGNYLVVNLGAPLNSPEDDFGLIINKDSLSGYFTSSRPGGKGGDDIYSFFVNKINLRVLSYDNHSKEILTGSKIALMGEDGNVIETKVTDADGTAVFMIDPAAKYQLIAENTSYVPEIRSIQNKNSLLDINQQEDIFLKRGFPYLTVEVIDKESGLIIPNAIIDIPEGKYDESELEENNGVIKMKLNESTEYTFYATAEEYFDKTVKFSSVDKKPGEYSLTIELEKLAAGKQFVLEDLYYDLNKYNIRPDAALVLDKLAKILADNPEIRIEIGSHTDSRASADYNLKLSQNRSESVLNYLVSRGIAKKRLVAKGYGESQLINKCADGVDCPEVDHQANRRTVIEILNPEIRRVKRGTKNVYYF